jgi:hypothetical protein
MKTSTVVQQFVEFLGEASEATAPVGARVDEGDAARSEENIQKWMSYLPKDCIRTMIEMGWDVTT